MSDIKDNQGSVSHGRLAKEAAEAFIDIYEAPHLEREMLQFAYFIKVDFAHVVMLAEKDILPIEQAGKLLNALKKLEKKGVDSLNLNVKHGSMLFQIEQFICSEVGENLGGKMHIGRSRLDQGPTVRRLFKRDKLVDILDAIIDLRVTLINLAKQHIDVIMPGYTCLQHANPAVFGHYLLSFVSKLDDDFNRLVGAYGRLNLNPLGGAGLSGTSWPIDRHRTTELLGFDGLVKNSKLVREAYYAAEVASGLSMMMSTLNDLATDLHIWSSYEFGFVELADEYCGTSSIFPQKKNPAALEAIKFIAGEAISWPSIILTTFRAEGTGDVVMREAVIIDRAFSSSLKSLKLMGPVMQSLTVNTDRMRITAAENWSTATVLADELVRNRELSFRSAHTIVGCFIRLAIERGLTVKDVNGELLDEAALAVGLKPPKFKDSDVKQAFDIDVFVQGRVSTGSVSPTEIKILSDEADSDLSKSVFWLKTTKNKQLDADMKMRSAINNLSNDI